MFYTIQNNGLLTAENKSSLTRFYDNVLPLPVDYEQDKYIVKNNELILNPEWDEIALNKAREAKIKENDTKRDNALIQGVEYKEVLFDSDTDQKVNLLATVTAMSDEDMITWFGMDNQPLECNKSDLINIGGLITQLHSFCWSKNAEIKALINEAKGVQEVNLIEIDYSMTEETKESEVE